MSLTCTKVSDNFGKNYEYTGFDGSAVWSELHRLMQDKKKMWCENCRLKGVKLMNGLHDSVNIHLNKKAQHPADLKFLHKYVTWSVQHE